MIKVHSQDRVEASRREDGHRSRVRKRLLISQVLRNVSHYVNKATAILCMQSYLFEAFYRHTRSL